MALLQISNVFTAAAVRLPKATKAKLVKTLHLLAENPHHPSLHTKKVRGALRDDMYEARVDDAWRIILSRGGDDTLNLVYVGHHDEALEHGSRLALLTREPISQARTEAVEVHRPPCTVPAVVQHYLSGHGSLAFSPVALRELLDQVLQDPPAGGVGEIDSLRTLWDICEGDRELCSRVLCFICGHGYAAVYIRHDDHLRLCSAMGRDERIYTRWAVSSKCVDFISELLLLREAPLNEFLHASRFNPHEMCNPHRNTRFGWLHGLRVLVDAEPKKPLHSGFESSRPDPPIPAPSIPARTLPVGPDVPNSERTLQHLWDFCGSSRTRCSRVLCFICGEGYADDVWITPADRARLLDAMDRNVDVYTRWSVASGWVDFVGMCILVDPAALDSFLERRDFNDRVTYNPNRWTRRNWLNSVRVVRSSPGH